MKVYSIKCDKAYLNVKDSNPVTMWTSKSPDGIVTDAIVTGKNIAFFEHELSNILISNKVPPVDVTSGVALEGYEVIDALRQIGYKYGSIDVVDSFIDSFNTMIINDGGVMEQKFAAQLNILSCKSYIVRTYEDDKIVEGYGINFSDHLVINAKTILNDIKENCDISIILRIPFYHYYGNIYVNKELEIYGTDDYFVHNGFAFMTSSANMSDIPTYSFEHISELSEEWGPTLMKEYHIVRKTKVKG